MTGQIVLCISAFLFAFSAVSDALAIGFEVDTPLDPFLGGLTKMRRQLVRRVKDLSTDDSTNRSPVDQLNMLFAQPPPPVTYPQFNFPSQTTQQLVTTQLPLTTLERRKVGLNQIPPPIAQAMDAQLMTLLHQIQNQGVIKTGLSYPSLPGGRQVQQLTQALPFRAYTQHCPVTQQKQNFF